MVSFTAGRKEAGLVSFTACRKEAEVVVPARATPREVKSLSDVDNQLGVRLYMTAVDFFRSQQPGQAPEQVASTLKAALAEALVHYYPMAGRLREVGKRLEVDCTAEGAVLVEAHADVRLEELGTPVAKPHPCVGELMCDVGDTRDVVGKPLLYLQVTQLSCGGVVLALTACHCLVDVTGMYQILRCITDLAKGQALPTVLPTWDRELLVANGDDAPPSEATPPSEALLTPPPPPSEATPPPPTLMTPPSPPPPSLLQDQPAVTRYFHFGPKEIAVLRTLAAGTVFELITAAVWRCRAEALEFPPDETARLFFVINGRGAWKRDPPLPPGFYGNAGLLANTEASTADLCSASLEFAVGLVRQAKLTFTDEHFRSYLNMIPRGNKSHAMALHWSSFIVSDVTRCVDKSLDIGSWAEHVGGCPILPGDDTLMSSLCLYRSCKETNGVLVPICLPELAMGRFASQIAALTNV